MGSNSSIKGQEKYHWQWNESYGCLKLGYGGVSNISWFWWRHIYFGMGEAEWDNRRTQMEYLFNTHELLKNGVIVSEILTQYVGDQGMIVNDITVPFELICRDIISFNQRAQTKNKLSTLKIHWVIYLMSEHHIRKTSTCIATTICKKELST